MTPDTPPFAYRAIVLMVFIVLMVLIVLMVFIVLLVFKACDPGHPPFCLQSHSTYGVQSTYGAYSTYGVHSTFGVQGL